MGAWFIAFIPFLEMAVSRLAVQGNAGIYSISVRKKSAKNKYHNNIIEIFETINIEKCKCESLFFYLSRYWDPTVHNCLL